MSQEIENLTKLRELTLAYNLIEVFPLSLTRLPSLEYLDFSGNQLLALPPGIGGMKKLKVFLLGYNNLWHLPQEINELPLLKDLRLSGSPLLSLPIELPSPFLEISGK